MEKEPQKKKLQFLTRLKHIGWNTSENQKYGKMTPIVSEWLDFFFWIVFYLLKAYFKSFRGVKLRVLWWENNELFDDWHFKMGQNSLKNV
jgi:hypothetical protein